MINLTYPPAFGFETVRCNSEEYVTDIQKKSYEETKAQTKNILNELNVDEKSEMPDFKMPDFNEIQSMMSEGGMTQTAWKTANWSKFWGYWPLLGISVGVERLKRSLNTTEEMVPNRKYHIIRSVFEIACLGFLLLIPDLLITAYRNWPKFSSPQQV